MKKLILAAILPAVMIIQAYAQLPIDGIHSPVGLDGIKGGSLPAPGISVRDDNLFYYGTSGLLPDYKSFVYLQAPQVTWMTGYKILAADYGMDAMIPFIENDTTYKQEHTFPSGERMTFTDGGNHFGLGDLKLEPILLGWRWKHFAVSAGYALWVPTGDYNNSSLVNLGDGMWTHMVTLGGVWYPGDGTNWAVSVLNHYEFNTQVPGFHRTTFPSGATRFIPENIHCSTYSLEWGISRTIFHSVDLGIVGYYQQQFTKQTTATTVFNNSEVAGIGPEIRSEIPSAGLTVSLRYAYEFAAVNRPQGHTVDLTLTKSF
jgi:hypothetical protein